MDNLVDTVIDFVRVRQLNIALAGVLTIVYILYQYWSYLCKGQEESDDECHRSLAKSRSRSRSCSSSKTRSGNLHHQKSIDAKRRGRKSHRRCPDCGAKQHQDGASVDGGSLSFD